jgi:hypothetical protein
MLYSSVGTLRYSGENRLVMEVDQELSNYYRSLIPKYFSVNRPRWAAHVTVVRDTKEQVVIRDTWGKYEGEEVTFIYDPVIKCGKIYYWLNVLCLRLETIRKELGLPCTSIYTCPPEGFSKFFHCTIANCK